MRVCASLLLLPLLHKFSPQGFNKCKYMQKWRMKLKINIDILEQEIFQEDGIPVFCLPCHFLHGIAERCFHAMHACLTKRSFQLACRGTSPLGDRAKGIRQGQAIYIMLHVYFRSRFFFTFLHHRGRYMTGGRVCMPYTHFPSAGVVRQKVIECKRITPCKRHRHVRKLLLPPSLHSVTHHTFRP